MSWCTGENELYEASVCIHSFFTPTHTLLLLFYGHCYWVSFRCFFSFFLCFLFVCEGGGGEVGCRFITCENYRTNSINHQRKENKVRRFACPPPPPVVCLVVLQDTDFLLSAYMPVFFAFSLIISNSTSTLDSPTQDGPFSYYARLKQRLTCFGDLPIPEATYASESPSAAKGHKIGPSRSLAGDRSKVCMTATTRDTPGQRGPTVSSDIDCLANSMR